jgi:hypothetical protein
VRDLCGRAESLRDHTDKEILRYRTKTARALRGVRGGDGLRGRFRSVGDGFRLKTVPVETRRNQPFLRIDTVTGTVGTVFGGKGWGWRCQTCVSAVIARVVTHPPRAYTPYLNLPSPPSPFSL